MKDPAGLQQAVRSKIRGKKRPPYYVFYAERLKLKIWEVTNPSISLGFAAEASVPDVADRASPALRI